MTKILSFHKTFTIHFYIFVIYFSLFIFYLQPEELTQALEYSNIVFSFLFAVEMLLKVAAYGLFGYISDGFNLFDGFIVVLR